MTNRRRPIEGSTSYPVRSRSMFKCGCRPMRASVRWRCGSMRHDVPMTSLDPLRMREVLANLLTNALHHTAAGGGVTITIKPSDARVLLTVTDTGSGIAVDDLPKVFELLQRDRVARLGTRSDDRPQSGRGARRRIRGRKPHRAGDDDHGDAACLMKRSGRNGMHSARSHP
jgi:hypothetical protein